MSNFVALEDWDGGNGVHGGYCCDIDGNIRPLSSFEIDARRYFCEDDYFLPEDFSSLRRWRFRELILGE